jgi:SNF2 family DNA or RNA helicase
MREIQKHTYLKALAIPPGKKASLEFLRENMHGDWDILLVHPENLINSGGEKGKKAEVYGPVTKLLKTMPFDMILVDEWHQYKNLSAKRTKCVLSLLGEIRDRERNLSRAIVMTGTPISESPLNAYVTLKVLSNDNLPHVSKFESYFTVKKDFTYGNRGTFAKVVGHKNLAELKARIERVSIRRTKDDMKGFPDKIFAIRDVLLDGKQLDLYKTVCGEVVSGLAHSSIVNLGEFFSSASSVRLRQLLNHPAFLNEDCESSKYAEIDRILEELFADPEQKVIIWTEYRKAVDLIYDRWNEEYGVIKIYGGVDIDDKLASSFENDDRPRIAACIPAKAGTGVDFLARARTSIYVDRPYSYTLYQQSLDRIHRRVKTEGELSRLDRIRSQPATIMFLDVPGSIDELVRDRLMNKSDVAEALLTSDEKLIEIGRSDLLQYLR